MTYLRTSHNLFALILVLLISLIANPVFAMSSHMSLFLDDTPKSTTTTSHHPDTSPNQPSTAHHEMSNNGQHCSDCQPSLAASDSDCSSMEMMANCTHCDSRHCQYSDLPALLTGLTDAYNDHYIPAFIAAQPISRNENALRPPIH